MGHFVKTQDSIPLDEFTNFLAKGSLLRKDGKYHLFRPLKGLSSDKNNQAISISCAYFFDPSQGLHDTVECWLTMEPFQFRELLSSVPGVNGVRQARSQLSWCEANHSDFEASFAAIQEKIKAGAIYKAVPVVFEETTLSMDAVAVRADLLLCLTEASEHLWVYGCWDQKQGIVGATPEVLFHKRGQILETMALAGTMPKEDANSRMSLLEDLKEVDEHSLVVDDLAKTLSAWGTVGVQGPQILELPTLYHLQTLLQVFTKQELKASDLIRALHPTPALGVAPREFGYQWLAQLPCQKNRAFFGAPMTFDWGNEALSLVMIRSLQWHQDCVRIGSGCGLVAGSELEREWKELKSKRDSVKKILGFINEKH